MTAAVISVAVAFHELHLGHDEQLLEDRRVDRRSAVATSAAGAVTVSDRLLALAR